MYWADQANWSLIGPFKFTKISKFSQKAAAALLLITPEGIIAFGQQFSCAIGQKVRFARSHVDFQTFLITQLSGKKDGNGMKGGGITV